MAKPLSRGRMRHYVLIQKRTYRKDENNELYPESDSRAWTTLIKDVPAEIKTVTGGERVRGFQVESDVTSLVNIYHRSDIDATNRIIYGNRILNIERATDVRGDGMYLTCQCKEVQ